MSADETLADSEHSELARKQESDDLMQVADIALCSQKDVSSLL